MKKTCVIGFPVKQSLSPVIHSYWLKEHRLDGSYVAREVRPEDAAEFLKNLRAHGFVGCNVTIPHKEVALAVADEVTPLARTIGAANTIWYEGDKLLADNSDAPGFLANLDENAPGWDNIKGKALVLGAGGAARAIIVALHGRGFQVVLSNRTPQRAMSLTHDLDDYIHGVCPWGDYDALIPDLKLVVNTTSLGMTGEPELEFPVEKLMPGTVVTDVVYKPLITTLLRRASQAGLQSVTGIGMLLHQATPGFERWYGIKPEVDDNLRRLVLTKLLSEV